MDSCDFVDSVKLDKAVAVASHRRFKIVAKPFQLIEVLVAVALISWSSARLPSVLKLSSEYFFAFSSPLLNQHVVFLVGNVIVGVCYVLSRRTDAGNDSGGSELYRVDDRFSGLSRERISEGASDEDPVPPRNETEGDGEGDGDGEEGRNLMIRFEKSIVKTESEVAAETAIRQAAKQIERFRRTQSEKLKRQISIKPRRELRRSATEGRSSMIVTSGNGGPTVEKLSNEDFRIAVEDFISKQQKFIQQQSLFE